MTIAGSTTNRTTRTAATAAATALPIAPTVATMSVMDSVVPTIPDVTFDDIEKKMPHPTLTKIEGEPDYSTMSVLREELIRNAIAVKSTFGGGKHGHYSSITKPATYLIEAGVEWTVSEGGGVYPSLHRA